MENEELEIANSQNSTESTESDNEESVESTETEETGFDIDAEVKKQTATIFARMKKAEQEAKELKVKLATNSGNTKTPDIASTDLYALMESKVPQEDIEVVQKYAKLEGVSIAEALKAPLLKSILSEKSEKRKTAEITHTGTTRRGASKLSDDALLQAARKGNLTNISDDDMLRLASLKG